MSTASGDIRGRRAELALLTQWAVAVPDVLDNEDTESFGFSTAKKASRYSDTQLADLIEHINDLSTVDVAMLKRRYVYGFRSSLPNHPKTWSWYRCLYCEIDDGANTFLLYDGKWYRVTRDYVETITLQVKAYVVPSTLPNFDRSRFKDEEDYNKTVSLALPGYLLLDRDLVHHGGSYDEIEICDLFGLDKRFVHVKRWSSSATLSHLFNQGEVPARLLIQDEAFRKKVIAKLSGSHAALIAPDGIKASEFTVTFGVTSASPKSLHESLPLFSRMTFLRTASMLETYGYKVELMKIDVVKATPAMAVVATAPLTAAVAAAAP